MIEITHKQFKNLDEAKAMWSTIPERNVAERLSEWRNIRTDKPSKAPTCKTIACFGGWCAYWPAFQEQGIHGSSVGSPTKVIQGTYLKVPEVSLMLFGVENMFVVRGYHPQDKIALPATSDWQIVMNRIDWMLENCFVLVDQEYSDSELQDQIEAVKCKLMDLTIAERSKNLDLQDLQECLTQLESSKREAFKELLALQNLAKIA